MRKILSTILCAGLAVFFVACGGNKVDDSTANKYITQAEEIVSLLNGGEYQEIHAMFDEQMKAGLTIGQMEELTPVIQGSRDFKEINKSSVEEKEGMYIVVLAAKYSEENRVFTITFNDKDQVVGLYIK